MPGVPGECGMRYREKTKQRAKGAHAKVDLDHLVCVVAVFVMLNEDLVVKCAILWTLRLTRICIVARPYSHKKNEVARLNDTTKSKGGSKLEQS